MSIVQLSKFWALSRDSYIRLSYLFLCVKCFFHLFSSFLIRRPGLSIRDPPGPDICISCFVLTLISGTCYIISSVLINVNFFFRLFLSFFFMHFYILSPYSESFFLSQPQAQMTQFLKTVRQMLLLPDTVQIESHTSHFQEAENRWIPSEQGQ